MGTLNSVRVATLCPRIGQGTADGEALVAPITQSTTFCREGIDSDAEHAYSRVSNPTVSTLETALGRLEQAPPAVAFASGLAAEAALFLALLKSGDHVICGQAVYGGTTRLLRQLLADLGIEISFVDATDPAEVAVNLRPNTKLVFVETPANPTLDLTDIAAIAKLTRGTDASLAVDNTFQTAVLQQPLELGADISVYSTTKFTEGHSAALGGAIVARDEELLERLRFVRKCTGGIQAPFNAWLTIQGLKTLPLRIRAQSETAGRVARWLADSLAVARVFYPGLRDGGQAAIAARQHLGGHGAVVSFEIEGGTEVAQRLLGRLRLFRFVEHVGGVESLITHPATMTHADVPPEQRARVGVTDGLIRLSIGLEHVDDIIADLDQAIEFATRSDCVEAEQEVAECATV